MIDFNDIAGVERHLRERLTQPLPGADAHLAMASRPARADWRPDDRPSRAHRAAVLILLYAGPRGVTLPLTVRHSDLPHHPGQVSLPGGRIDVDESAEHAALRETHEEIGVSVDQIRIAGPLSTLWVVVSNHIVQPYVGIADARPDFVLATREVESLVEVALEDLHDASRMGLEGRIRDGVAIDVPYFELEDHRVWGATAMILNELRELLG